MSADVVRPQAVVELLASDLTPHGGIFCPHPKAHMPLWSSHPRVFLAVASAASGGKCPYCGTVYRLKPGEAVGRH